MKHFNSKKGLLTMAALATCLFASAETTVVAENVAPDGKTFTYEADIDFSKQSLEVVVDLTNSGYYSQQDILSVGENATVMASGYSNANALHLIYTPNSKQLDCAYYAGDRYYNTKSDVEKTEHTITLSKDGLFFDGALWEGTTTYSTATAADANTLAQLLALDHIYIGSTFASYGSYSFATYKSIKVVDNETETPEPPVTITPDTLQIPLTETYTPLATHNNEFIGITDIDFDKQTLTVAVDATQIGGVEGILSIGEDIASLNGAEAGNIHVYASPFATDGVVTDVTMGIMYYNNTQTRYVKRAILSIPVESAKVVFELSKENGLTTKVGDAEADVKLDAETLAALLGVKSIQVGSILSGVGGISAAVNNTTCPIDSILVNAIPPVAKPESIPFDLTSKGGWIDEGETFAWDTDIDWDTQALEIVMDLSSCNSVANQNVVSIAGTENDLSNWGAKEAAAQVHFYYTKSTNNMEVDYMSSSSGYRNSNKSLFTSAGDTILVSRDGVKVNSTLWEGADEWKSSNTSLNATTIASLLTLDHIWVGSTQGDGRSWATYKSIKLIDYLPEVVTLDENAEDYIAPEVESPVTVNLAKTFNVNEWNTFCVPFDITAEQAKAQFGDDVKIAQWKKSVTTDGLPEFETVTSIAAGVPYLIYPTAAATQLNDTITGYQFTKVESFIEEPSEDYEATFGEEKHLMFAGCFTPAFYSTGEEQPDKDGTTVGVACWNMSGTKFVVAKQLGAEEEPVETAGFHAVFVTDDLEADLSNWTLDGTPVNTYTGIEAAASATKAQSHNVYSINGQLLKANANDLSKLPLGIYVVNGKKYIRK